MLLPETRFATVGTDRVAYQVVGHGAQDLLYTTGFWNHLDIEWEDPDLARFYRRLASFARLIRFDRRGTGLSDRLPDDGRSAVEHWLEDCLAVLDTVRAGAPVMLAEGTAEVGPLVLQFATRHPARCSGLILANTGACPVAREGYPEGLTDAARLELREEILRSWGTPDFAADLAVPSRAGDESFRRWWAKLSRAMASPRAVAENLDCWDELDCRALLPGLSLPTLVLAATHFRIHPVEQSRYVARHIPGARLVELPGGDVLLCWLAPDSVDLIEEFVTGRRAQGGAERAVLTVLFTDIVDSTGRAAALGNAAWRQLLDRHDHCVREQVAAHGGRLVDTSGDGTLTTFHHPAPAIDCAHALVAALRPLGIGVRAGLHMGEVELRGDGRVGGVAVHVGARVMAAGGAGDVLVSHTVQGILLGSHYRFQERGLHELRGVPGRWLLFATSP